MIITLQQESTDFLIVFAAPLPSLSVYLLWNHHHWLMNLHIFGHCFSNFWLLKFGILATTRANSTLHSLIICISQAVTTELLSFIIVEIRTDSTTVLWLTSKNNSAYQIGRRYLNWTYGSCCYIFYTSLRSSSRSLRSSAVISRRLVFIMRYSSPFLGYRFLKGIMHFSALSSPQPGSALLM